jgi:hypothetical protein
MRLAEGPRPLAIRAFAAAFLAAAALRLARGLTDLPLAQAGLSHDLPWFAWDRDWTIVALSAWFTIALIPVTWVYLFAAPFARWLVLGFGVVKLGWALWALPERPLGGFMLAELALIGIAMLSLLTPEAARWFAREPQSDREIFE